MKAHLIFKCGLINWTERSNFFRPCLKQWGCVLMVLWGFLKLELCSAIFPKAAPAGTHVPAHVDVQGHCSSSLFLWSPSWEPCWETPRLVKVCQQPKQPASSSKESHRLGTTRVLCPGTEHLFLETGATSITAQPNQVSLPGRLPGTSATSSQAKAHLLPAGGIPKQNSFLALPRRATQSNFPWPLGHK